MYKGWVASSGKTFKPSSIKIRQLVQQLLGRTHWYDDTRRLPFLI